MGFFNKFFGKTDDDFDDEDDLLDDEKSQTTKNSNADEKRTEYEREQKSMQDNETEFRGRNTPLHNVVDFVSHNPKIQETVAAFKMKVVIIEPKSFDDAQQVANCMREKRPVVVNFEKTEREVAKRILDFISGTTYALAGEINRVGNNVFLCAPSNVNVAYTEDDKKGSADMPWMGKR